MVMAAATTAPPKAKKAEPVKKAASVKKAAPKKTAPVKKAAPKKTAPAKKTAPVKQATRAMQYKGRRTKAVAPKPIAPGTFAYGLPGNFNILGGGELNFDPGRLLKGKSKAEVFRYREAELTHGRIAMLSALGFIVQESFHPLFDGVNRPVVEQLSSLGENFGFTIPLLAVITFAEFYRITVAFRDPDGENPGQTWDVEVTNPGRRQARQYVKKGYTPGQIGFDPLNYAPTDPAEFRIMQEKELAHARLAMLASTGFIVQEWATGQTWGSIY